MPDVKKSFAMKRTHSKRERVPTSNTDKKRILREIISHFNLMKSEASKLKAAIKGNARAMKQSWTAYLSNLWSMIEAHGGLRKVSKKKVLEADVFAFAVA